MLTRYLVSAAHGTVQFRQSGLNGSFGSSNAVAVLYGLNLTVIATLNAGLWWLINRDGRHRHEFISSVFPVLVLLPGTLVALFAPRYAQYLWFLAFAGLFIRRFFRTSPAVSR